MQLRHAIRQRFRGIVVEGSNYPVPESQLALANVLSAVQFGFIGLVLFGESMFSLIDVAAPGWYHGVKDNKFGCILMAWMLGNAVQSGLTNTGAFEIAYDGEIIFSKQELGRLPSVQEVVSGIESVMERHGTKAPSRRSSTPKREATRVKVDEDESDW